MKSVSFTPMLVLVLGFATTSQAAQVLMLDFGPTTTTAYTNSPYHTANTSFTDTTWNTVGTTDIASGLLYSDGSTATGVSLNLGTASGSTTLNLSSTPTGSSALGGTVSTGVYAGTSVGTDGIFTGSNGTSTSVGLQIGGLAAGTYNVYISSRNTSLASTSGYRQIISVGTSSMAGNFDYSGYGSANLIYTSSPTPVATTSWAENNNYEKLSVVLTSGDYLNIAVAGQYGDTRGFLNSVQIVSNSVIPESSTYALFGGAAMLFFAGVRRRRA